MTGGNSCFTFLLIWETSTECITTTIKSWSHGQSHNDNIGGENVPDQGFKTQLTRR